MSSKQNTPRAKQIVTPKKNNKVLEVPKTPTNNSIHPSSVVNTTPKSVQNANGNNNKNTDTPQLTKSQKKRLKLQNKKANNNNTPVKPETTTTTTTTTTKNVTPSKQKDTTMKNKQSQTEEPIKKIRVYADGIYDLFHFGHARSLQQAKLLFENTHLIVGVCNDEITHKLKGKTVMNHQERAESLRHCKWVDEVVENAPWIVTQEFIDQHNIDFVAHGEDLCLDKDGNDVYQFVKDKGQFKTIKRTDGISTSDIILRIVKDYDSYVKRNLARGYSGKDMNVGVFKEKALQVEEKINQIKSRVKVWSDQTENTIVQFLQRFSNRLPKNWETKLKTLSPQSSYDAADQLEVIIDQEDMDHNSISSPPHTPSFTSFSNNNNADHQDQEMLPNPTAAV
ncbi:hypothetical protein CYY_002104 [Polysphondylium violaceum]|uniref:choline-phosphate cytidylyltransferase n=1 Tax=Polysphondylium violaceum TaxID=133409 RepID=A0A8J4V387_9MYCE|nr:hypothetical protein CYY_002104 [Polysphondylium violaceum]